MFVLVEQKENPLLLSIMCIYCGSEDSSENREQIYTIMKKFEAPIISHSFPL